MMHQILLWMTGKYVTYAYNFYTAKNKIMNNLLAYNKQNKTQFEFEFYAYLSVMPRSNNLCQVNSHTLIKRSTIMPK